MAFDLSLFSVWILGGWLIILLIFLFWQSTELSNMWALSFSLVATGVSITNSRVTSSALSTLSGGQAFTSTICVALTMLTTSASWAGEQLSCRRCKECALFTQLKGENYCRLSDLRSCSLWLCHTIRIWRRKSFEKENEWMWRRHLALNYFLHG